MTILAPSLERWLGAADSSAPNNPWDDADVTIPALPARSAAHFGVLTISGMPRALRPRVETAMVVCIPGESDLEIPDADPLTTEWFTAWHRSTGPSPGAHLSCRQLLTGSSRELDHLGRVVAELARSHGFTAELRVLD